MAVIGPDKRFPNFYSRDSGVDAPWNLENSVTAAGFLRTHFSLLPSPSGWFGRAHWVYRSVRTNLGGGNKCRSTVCAGVLIGVPIPVEHALDGDTVEKHVKEALEAGEARRIQGKDVTPFLLSQIQLLTRGSSLSSSEDPCCFNSFVYEFFRLMF